MNKILVHLESGLVMTAHFEGDKLIAVHGKTADIEEFEFNVLRINGTWYQIQDHYRTLAVVEVVNG